MFPDVVRVAGVKVEERRTRIAAAGCPVFELCRRNEGPQGMKSAKLIVALACVVSAAGGGAAYVMSSAQAAQVAPHAEEAPQAKVTAIMSKDLPDIPGKEGLMLNVEYPPGSVDPNHRHYANAFVYVLEGTIVMQVRGGPEMTLSPGQTFYEGPDDVHVVGRNASQTEPAKFVVFLVKDIGAPVFVPAT